MKRRIIRHDAYNWAIQEWQEGGDIVERGRYAGQEKKATWKNPSKFYPSLEHAANAMLEEIVADNWNSTGSDVKTMIQDAKLEVTQHIYDLISGLKDDTLIGILQERGYVIKNANQKRGSYVDDVNP